MCQEGDQILLEHGSRRFELAITAAVKQFAVAIQDGDGGHAFIQRNPIGFDEFRIFFAFPDIHMDQKKTVVNDFPSIAFVQRTIQNMTVVTPVSAKDEQYPFLFVLGSFERVLDFLIRVDVCGIEIGLN